MQGNRLIPAGTAAVQLGVSRERLVRMLQRQEIRGAVEGGRYFVSAVEVARLRRESPAETPYS